MPMPSLLKFFAFVGAGLLGLLTLANFLLEPSTGATVVATQKPLAVQHDPRASKIERWRDEQAALKAAEGVQPTATVAPVQTSVVPKATAAPVVAAIAAPAVAEPVAPAPVQTARTPVTPVAAPPAVAAPAMQTADTSAAIEGLPTESELASAAASKRKIVDAARKKRLARAEAREMRARKREAAISSRRQAALSNRQDQYFYGQQSAYAPPAPRQDFGPFFGRAW